ncbi:FG-GAP-like repeat-containing protein [Microbispora amethystogenes]|uniref:SGNH hydrolase-type esterase domain-containing protein n=1 Tax=Microbispora amethystogenes TaxID=1427754 RepID=A0ABQ4F894_9ACTN|nr:FG-GAP-like repeat-containing protein [Microbispora amethystogenes]GIH31040.1 hypothetical protein Mam01_12040 [Microbispora amethystogenes]
MRASRSRTFTRLRRGRVLTALLVTLSLLLQVGLQPAAKAATTVTLDFELPEEYARTEIGEWIAEMNGRNDLLSDTIREEMQAIPGGIPGGLDDWVDFDGTLALRGATLTVTVESDEVLTNLDWWQTLLIDIAATAIYLVIRVICTAALLPESGPLAPLANAGCSALASFFGTFSRGAIKNAVEENPDPNRWSNLLIDSFVDAAKGAMWDGVLGPVTNQFGAKMFSWVARKLVEVGGKIKAWWWAGNLGLTMESVAGNVTSHTPQYLEEIELAARRSGSRALRVMPLGDSITHGVGGNPGGVGYRARLWDLLQDDTDSLDFVGSVDSGQGHIPDTDHEGHPRWWVSQIDALAAECAIARYRPNVVILHIGTNDLANGQDHLTTLARYSKLINDLHDVAPLTTIIVSSLVPSTTAATNSRIALFNAYLATAVNTWLAEGKRVRLVSNGELGVTTADLADTLHPNNNGYRKMADAYHNEIKAALAAGQIMPALPGDNRPCTPAPGNPTPPPPPGPGPAGWDYVGKIASVPGATRAQVRFADLNGDGRDDYLLVGDQGQVKAWLNNRAGQGGGWNYAGEVASGAASRDRVRFADINGDGRDDYLSVGDGGEVTAWLNVGTGDAVSWAAKGVVATGVGATRDQVRFADVDVDGRDDYLVVDGQGKVRAWLNGYTAAGGAWTSRGEIASGVGASGDQVRFHDLDGDGDDDYSVFDSSGYVRAWLNNVGGNRPWIYQGTVVGGAGVGPAGLLMADIDGNGRDDFLTVNDAGEVAAWLNDRWGRPDPWDYQGQIASTDAPRQEVRFADLNGDGRDDYLLVKDNGRVQAWLNVREADRVGWNYLGDVASGSGPRDQIRFADLNGDGRDDYLVVGDQGQVNAWFNTGTGDGVAWTSKGQIASGSAPRDQIRFADVDGDNRDDYLVVDSLGKVRLWRNTGTATAVSWQSQGEIASGVGAAGATVTFADVNGDRKDDYLVVGDYGQLRAWINNRGGSGSAWIAAGEIASGVGVARANVGLAEINGDRRADYLAHDSLGGVKAWFNNGAGGTGSTGGTTPPMQDDPQPPPPDGLPLCVANRCR